MQANPSLSSKVLAWLKASRPASQSYIFLALVLGQTMAYHAQRRWSWEVFFWVTLWGILDQLYIVYANDLADIEADQANQTATIFSGGSRVLVEGSLTPKELRRGLIVVLIAFGCVSLWLSWRTTGWITPLSLLSLALLWAYSYPPLKISYRGGGEILQMFGVGFVLPILGFLAQTKNIQTLPWEEVFYLLPTQLACAMSTALPDAPSDRAVGKKTTSVWMGESIAKGALLSLHLVSLWFSWRHFSAPNGKALRHWLLLPFVSLLLATLLAKKASPGSRSINLMIFFSLLTSLSMIGIHAFSYVSAAPLPIRP
ncbi:MAG: prenyltransferase [Myxococcales bacterium]|nr:prenyltransferase [Myxococcales bacterium]